MNVEEGKWLLETLRKIQFFSTFSLDNIDSILKHFQKYDYPANKVIIKEGMPGEAFFVLRKGTARVFRKKLFLFKQYVTELKEGSFFGEMALVFDQATTATVVTSEPSEVYMLLKTDFQSVLKNNPGLLNEIRFVAEKRKFEADKNLSAKGR
jgi:CRP-like cAMP-binding protein